MTTGALDILHFCYMDCQLEMLSLPEHQHLLHLTVLMILLLHTAHTVLLYLNCTYFVSLYTSPPCTSSTLANKTTLLSVELGHITSGSECPPPGHYSSSPSFRVGLNAPPRTGLPSSGHEDLSHSSYQTECPHQEAFSDGSFAASS